VLLAVGAAAVALALLAVPAGGLANGVSYVAMGDSFPAGPGTGEAVPGTAPECLASTGGYPNLVAAALGLSLQNTTCSGATRLNFTSPQYGDQPAQFEALSSATEVVSVSMGGNDNNLFQTLVTTCTQLDEGHPGVRTPLCKKQIGSTLNSKIKEDAAPYTQALAQIHLLAPNAKVFVVGYPDYFPSTGSCYSTLPWTSGDDHWASTTNKKLDAMIKRAARADRYTYVDTYGSFAGHDLCEPLGTRWVEPLNDPADGAPLHPNALGHEHVALIVEQAMRDAGVS
jgi:lysophospholipase L1-like esterase